MGVEVVVMRNLLFCALVCWLYMLAFFFLCFWQILTRQVVVSPFWSPQALEYIVVWVTCRPHMSAATCWLDPSAFLSIVELTCHISVCSVSTHLSARLELIGLSWRHSCAYKRQL